MVGAVASGLVLAVVLPFSLDSGTPVSSQSPPRQSLSGQIGPTQTLPAGRDGSIAPRQHLQIRGVHLHPVVPSLVGLGVYAAARRLTGSGFCLGVRADPDGKKFVVVRQAPPADSAARRRSRVILTVGLGLQPSQVNPRIGYNIFLRSIPLGPGCSRNLGRS
jgi:hypothetical protein